MAPRKGKRKDTLPMTRLGVRCFRSDAGSISAPARKVRRPEPKVARKSIHGVGCKPRKFPSMTPTNISTRATEMPSRIEMTLASRASAIQADATNHTFSISALLPSRVSYPGSSRAGETTLLSGHPGLIRSHQPRGGSGGILPLWQTPLPVIREMWHGGSGLSSLRGEERRYHLSLSSHASSRACWRVVGSQPAWRTAHAVPREESEEPYEGPDCVRYSRQLAGPLSGGGGRALQSPDLPGRYRRLRATSAPVPGVHPPARQLDDPRQS